MLDRNTVNRVILMGRIANEPHWHFIQGQKLLHFPLITGEKIKKGPETIMHEETHIINIPENNVPAEVLNKGIVLYVQGRLQTKMSLDENLVKHYRTEIVATNVEIIDPALVTAHVG